MYRYYRKQNVALFKKTHSESLLKRLQSESLLRRMQSDTLLKRMQTAITGDHTSPIIYTSPRTTPITVSSTISYVYTPRTPTKTATTNGYDRPVAINHDSSHPADYDRDKGDKEVSQEKDRQRIRFKQYVFDDFDFLFLLGRGAFGK